MLKVLAFTIYYELTVDGAKDAEAVEGLAGGHFYTWGLCRSCSADESFGLEHSILVGVEITGPHRFWNVV